MNALHTVLLILHFLGLAAILGGSVEQWRTRAKLTSPVTLWGARAQLVTGLALVALVFTGDDAADANHLKIGVKLLVALVVAAVAEMNARKPVFASSAPLIAVLTTVNVVVAAAWT